MTAATMRIERSGPAIREALARYAPAECPRFESELGQALATAAQTLDLAPVQEVLDRWWGVAAIRANPLSDTEQAQLARARAGDFSGLLTQDERGNWVRLKMPRYGAVWLEIVREQYAALPPEGRALLDARIEQLLENGRNPLGGYDEPSDHRLRRRPRPDHVRGCAQPPADHHPAPGVDTAFGHCAGP